MIKEITLIYKDKPHIVKIHRFGHPIVVKCQLNLSPAEIIYCKIRALIDLESGTVIKLRPHPEYSVFYHIDSTRVKDGGTYEILMRDYRKVNASVLDSQSMQFLKRRFDRMKNSEGHLTYNENAEFFNLKKRKYKKQVERQMNTLYEDLDAVEKVHLKKNRIHDMARARIEKGEDAIEEVARIVFSAMSQSSSDGNVTFRQFADHWARMYVMLQDVVQLPKRHSSTPYASTSSAANTPLSTGLPSAGVSENDDARESLTSAVEKESHDKLERMHERFDASHPSRESSGFRGSSIAQQGVFSKFSSE
eukprot:CAMPEP_0117442638 /NCGR_PEP_ID=MMETSP0759-20121206/4260_1 /TAXON_ID=63605 /ORGANISM="Percolomonas cosmopolitus, Strain WS" /LENGTH=305 /DNA_ID=CAMNT_0005234543 /DNA_START=41 /DNA_END=958 /DNA_ORIENTATION=-